VYLGRLKITIKTFYILNGSEQKQKLEQQLWNIANTLRGKMDAGF
jgi:hypothetical protein